MDVPLSADRAQSGAYTLVSAQNGSEQPPVYDNALASSADTGRRSGL